MKYWIVLGCLLIAACGDKAPVVSAIDTSTLEAPVAESIDSARALQAASTQQPGRHTLKCFKLTNC